MTTKALLVLNRKSAARADLEEMIERASKLHDLDVHVASSGTQLRAGIRKAVRNGRVRIVAGGGDGTINWVAASIARLELLGEAEMAFLPLGTANDFARGCGDSGDDIEASLSRALEDAAVPTDLGKINGKVFVNVASGGFGARITATTPKDLKARLGGLAYTLHGLSRLSEMRPRKCHFTIDGDEQIEAELSFLAVGNSRYAGGGFDVTTEALPDDGLLDLSLIRHDWSWEPGLLARELMNPRNRENIALVYRQFRNCRMEAEEPFHLNLDGEPMEAESFDITVLPGAIRLVR
ncbi:YegS/Rv2252/BmrU family lipid kinase [Aliiruegeria sabulilitoris]|uniref:YegS/Rv2252/BmrU family lipid kinase n=1 Tax=Aliiruegeria sabulilitoris TaxID=1510458 RepID=UPI00082B3B29|nr:YegS/Rv2252/BmrU family lipid kinase [Aliiruegeria sabulilitoris]NDR57236.1 YegS/Rv2252/BmrU family lipid kinase [Pseudoruegeria sp. M32A2M]